MEKPKTFDDFIEQEEQKRFISILSDYGFKVTFGNPNNTLFLRKAIQALIQSPVPIKKITFIKNEVSGITRDGRGGLFDIICEDEKGNVFIVEMQLADFKYFIHRVKFYAFHKFNEMVKKGKYRFNDLKRIYTISILAGQTYSTKQYHQIGKLYNQNGELIDEQITHVIVELGKFKKQDHEIYSNLDKLLYIMKLIDQVTLDKPVQFPKFWNEKWIQIAIDVLDKSNMPPEQRAEFEMILAHNASMVYAYEEEKKKYADKLLKKERRKAFQQLAQQKQIAQQQIEQQKQIAQQQIEQQKQITQQQIEQQKQITQQQIEQQKQIAQQQIEQQKKLEKQKQVLAIHNMLDMQLEPKTIAQILNVSLDMVLNIQAEKK